MICDLAGSEQVTWILWLHKKLQFGCGFVWVPLVFTFYVRKGLLISSHVSVED